ncbi:MAG: SDR family oxidoreductase [Dehalococcoidia bacterium]|uniref:SDR family NAD(P)-dependent oxidoreductase n=1 Tax=Candidatus Amarobacter glycogenicus TaxID=3140699 RepID=UPI001D8402CB|nr:SDR family oxidoreductase [Dehalococcoidia bacterium]MBK6563371.1 SDR family oxidoreductase [Dehalococcoidia bacterium]MBK7126069.1 SDR family oxidoreductase [Dehalococcoidia bacterium]MBK7329113.1 SDR family oxidoreductase [Dehalococcoidia bacterium]MBK7726698.1 SDR family oxidoreductase [Dehalococcoidia bacterium]
MGRLENQVAIITGAASGIGEGTVRKYVSEGARVVIADIQDERGGALAEELGPGTTYIRTDVSEEEQVAAAVGQAVSKWGRLDVMFNNAGFGGVSGNIEDLDMAAYDSTMAVLLRAVFAGSKHAVRQMKAQGSGCIINTASIAGLQAGFGPVTYSAAKAAVAHMSRCLAVELAPFNIRVNAICPGLVLTNIFTAAIGLPPEIRDAMLPKVDQAFSSWPPMGRSGIPEDIANAALWLASSEASYVTGQAITVDGGLTAGRSFAEMGGRIASAFGMDPAAMAPIRTNG